ncbi:MAG: hypothetical protein IPF70_20965 [Saprospiraceae bacterium]|nr:hypothetical protein [Saprospiraceae bacterium]
MKKLSFLSLLFLAISITSLLGQKVRYIHQIFDSVNVTNTYYGQNITVFASLFPESTITSKYLYP